MAQVSPRLTAFLLATSALFSAGHAFAQQPAPAGEAPATDASQPVDPAAEPVEEQPEVIVVRGRFIPDPQRTTSQVATFLTAADLARTGDDTAAAALTRLSGLSVVGGRFAFVRGLGDRYSSARLNRSPLPSPEPLRRTVPLDLFPSNILAGAAVQKTFSADFPGEFGGGVIDLQTLRAPREPFLNLKIGASVNTQSNLTDSFVVDGSDSDWTGYDDGLRDLPGPIAALIGSGTRINTLSNSVREQLGESLVNAPLSVILRDETGPNFEASIDAGRKFEFDGFAIGLVGVAAYNQSWTVQDATRQQVQGGVLGNNLRSSETTYEATTNALASVALEAGSHTVQLTGFYVHAGSAEAQIDTGLDFNAQGSTGQIWDESTGWYERELLFGQLRGDHEWGPLDLKWRAAISQSTRDAPYERSLRRSFDADGIVRYSVANSYNIRFSDLTDDVAGYGVDALYTFTLAGGREAVISAGVDQSSTEREYNFLALRFVGGNALPRNVQEARPDFLFSPENIQPARFVLQELVSTNDSYLGTLDVNAGYVQADVEVTDFIRATLGVRYEQAEQTVNTFDRFGNPGAGGVLLDNEYWLPAATVTWNFADDLQLRLGYSQTIARPQFRELALSSYFDPESDRVYRGNSGLVDSELQNFDARLEYYLGRNQFVTAAVFHKIIDRPIEEVQFSTSTFVFETTFINSPSAEVSGLELEYRTRFDMPFEGAFFEGKEWLFSTNYTYTTSEVQAEASDTVFDPISRTRISAASFNLDGSVLQGTPEHILNAQFGYQSDASQLTLIVGWVSERTLQRGLRQQGAVLPDVVEDPGVNVDLVYRRDFEALGQPFGISVSARNLLNERHVEFQESGGALGRTDFNSYDRGTSFSISLTAKY
jgi:outer membrane receptor protein involved in Fe transport